MTVHNAHSIINSWLDGVTQAQSPSEIAAAIAIVVDNWTNELRSIDTKGVGGAPDWAGYESEIWRLGEACRQRAKQCRWTGKSPFLDVAARIALDKKYGKGREIWVVLLGELGKAQYHEALGQLLSDEEVAGHAVDALLKAKVTGYASQVKDLAVGKRPAWVRSAARKYCERFPDTN